MDKDRHAVVTCRGKQTSQKTDTDKCRETDRQGEKTGSPDPLNDVGFVKCDASGVGLVAGHIRQHQEVNQSIGTVLVHLDMV